jgi:aryl-alcohol dehydrogenase-like predicted oxidoreductase
MKYRRIGSATTRVDISSVCLGALPFGAVIDEPTSFDILDRFVEAGGTFIDTANNYCCWKSGCTGDESEDTLGRWLASRGLRDQVVIASKAGARPDPAFGDRWPGSVEGLSAETLHRAVKGSLGRLGLDRIDVYYAHVEDRRVPLGETVRAFDDLVAEGLVGIAGCSNHTTGRIRRARLIAEAEGLLGYSVVQQRYTYLQPSPAADFDLQEHMDAELLEYAAGQEDLTLLGIRRSFLARTPATIVRSRSSIRPRTRRSSSIRSASWPRCWGPPPTRSCSPGCCSPIRRSYRFSV